MFERLSAWTVITLVCAMFTGCHSLPSVTVDSKIKGTGDEVGYLVGSVGITAASKISPMEQSLLFRKRGTSQMASAKLLDNWMVKSKQLKDSTGKASLFAIPLKPGHYEMYNINFNVNGFLIWKKEDFSIPLKVEAGQAFYLGDFRSNCVYRPPERRSQNGTQCYFIRTNQLERDKHLLAAEYPRLPEIQAVELKQIDTALPVIMDMERPLEFIKSLQGGK